MNKRTNRTGDFFYIKRIHFSNIDKLKIKLKRTSATNRLQKYEYSNT